MIVRLYNCSTVFCESSSRLPLFSFQLKGFKKQLLHFKLLNETYQHHYKVFCKPLKASLLKNEKKADEKAFQKVIVVQMKAEKWFIMTILLVTILV